MGTIDRWVRAGFAAGLGMVVAGCAAAMAPLLEGPPPTFAPPGAAMCQNLDPDPGEKIPGPQRDSVMAGRHRLIFPAGSTTVGNAPFRLVDLIAGYVVVRATPSGHRFTPEKGQLTISYEHCPDTVTGPFKIYRWNETEERWDTVPGSRHLPGERAVTAPLDSLSDYALGAG